MTARPEDLVDFGARVHVPDDGHHAEQVVTIAATPGPTLGMRFGAVAIADPWFPEMAPRQPVIALGGGDKATVLSHISLVRPDGTVDRLGVAASVGDLDRVVRWHPLVQEEEHFHLDVDSALGAFYEITDAAVLQPLFEDSLHMKGVYDRALSEPWVPMSVDDRVAAAVFLSPDGAGLCPVWAGFDRDGSAVAVVVDLLILGVAGRHVLTGGTR